MLFSCLLLPAFALFSLHCFMLLINTRKAIIGSYGEIGGALYGYNMRFIILASIVISQIGFVCAYTIFTAENLSAFVSAVTKGQHSMDVRLLILMQLIILLPCGMNPMPVCCLFVYPTSPSFWTVADVDSPDSRHLKTFRNGPHCRPFHHARSLRPLLL